MIPLHDYKILPTVGALNEPTGDKVQIPLTKLPSKLAGYPANLRGLAFKITLQMDALAGSAGIAVESMFEQAMSGLWLRSCGHKFIDNITGADYRRWALERFGRLPHADPAVVAAGVQTNAQRRVFVVIDLLGGEMRDDYTILCRLLTQKDAEASCEISWGTGGLGTNQSLDGATVRPLAIVEASVDECLPALRTIGLETRTAADFSLGPAKYLAAFLRNKTTTGTDGSVSADHAMAGVQIDYDGAVQIQMDSDDPGTDGGWSLAEINTIEGMLYDATAEASETAPPFVRFVKPQHRDERISKLLTIEDAIKVVLPSTPGAGPGNRVVIDKISPRSIEWERTALQALTYNPELVRGIPRTARKATRKGHPLNKYLKKQIFTPQSKYGHLKQKLRGKLRNPKLRASVIRQYQQAGFGDFFSEE